MDQEKDKTEEMKTNPGLCRCCLSEGCYKDLTAEYPWMSETEVYADMLLQCFDISLSQQPEGPDGANNLICEVCITRLRDASHFKKQVQHSERKFVNMMLLRREIQNKVMERGADQLMTHQVMIKEESKDLKVTAIEAPEAANNAVSYDMDALIKHEAGAVKGEGPQDLQKSAREDLKNIIEVDTGSKQFSCNICSKSFARQHCLRRHIILVHKRDKKRVLEKPFVSDICSNTFNSTQNNELQSHIRLVHGGLKQFSCNICNKSFSYESNLKIHLLIHSYEKRFGYDNCGKHFKLKSNLNSHIRLGHGGVKQFSCNICNKSFDKTTILKNHLQMHSGEKPFVCDVCSKTFALKHLLKCHLRIHSGVKSFSCNLCGKSFLRKSGLKSHCMVTHSKEKPFVCDICGKQLKGKSGLRLHMIAHSGIKRFKCNVCNKSFTQSGQLKLHHRRIHSGEKPLKFPCDVCGKKITKEDFKRHLRIHSGVKPFACHICSKSFIRASHVKRHLLTHSKTTL